MSRKSFSYSDVPDQLLSWSTNQTVPETSSVKDTLSQDIDELTRWIIIIIMFVFVGDAVA